MQSPLLSTATTTTMFDLKASTKSSITDFSFFTGTPTSLQLPLVAPRIFACTPPIGCTLPSAFMSPVTAKAGSHFFPVIAASSSRAAR